MVPLGRYSSRLHRAYTLFYVVGIIGAMQVPVVGWGPLKSLEQLSALAVFYCLQLLEYGEIQRRKKKLSLFQLFVLRVKVFIPALLAAFVGVYILFNMGYFGPLGARIRGLFVKHTRTGNPLVDSVAEHQPGSTQAYQTYLHHVYYLAPLGFFLSCARWTDANSFIVLWAYTAYYFASKMSRLVILLGPVAAALGGVALGRLFDLLITSAAAQALGLDEEEEEADASGGKDGKGAKGAKGKDGKKGGGDGKKSFKAPAPVAKGRRSKSKDGKASAVARKVEPGMIKNTLITVRRNYIWRPIVHPSTLPP
jgi:dolichyl-diphosphooligosaccharide--protein glycosyltransferase